MGHDAVKQGWSKAQVKQLRELARPKTLFMSEIAVAMGKSPAATRWKMHKLGLSYKSSRLGTYNAKHAHIREAAFEYFLTHSTDQTREHFGLTKSECRSLFSVGYRMPELSHLRKDTRRRDAWSPEEYLFLLRHAGLRDRDWIAAALKRGSRHAVKDCASDRLHGIWTKQMHGLPHKIVAEQLGVPGLKTVQTAAGPISETHSYRYIIVPWVVLADSQSKFSVEIRPALRAMSRFQKWIYGTTTTLQTMNRIKKAVEGKL